MSYDANSRINAIAVSVADTREKYRMALATESGQAILLDASGKPRERFALNPKPDMMFGEVNESVKAYGIGGHRHVAEIEQELAGLGAAAGVANPGVAGVDFLPHLIPMTRGILSAGHVRPTRPTDWSNKPADGSR